MPRKKSYVTATDMFCGAGGSSTGAVAAGAEVRLAMNHWDLAIETHNTNHPNTAHSLADISQANPRYYPTTSILISSPECTNHSLSKGRKRKNLGQMHLWEEPVDPGEERSRATMWCVPRWCEYHSYEMVIVENVIEARHWINWNAWLYAMHQQGYEHEEVYFNSMFSYPTPQSRDRVYIIFWKKGRRKPNLEFTPPAYCLHCEKAVAAVQSWKNPLKKHGRYGNRNQYVYVCPHGHGKVEPYYFPASTAIDWDYPTQKVGDRKKPLQPATLERIRKGLEKFNGHLMGETTSPEAEAVPFVVRHYSGGAEHSLSVKNPLPTVTTVDHNSLVQPFMTTLRRNHFAKSMEEPLDTVVAGGTHHGLVQPFLTSYYSNTAPSSTDEPVPTQDTRDRHALVQPFMVNYYTGRLSVDSADDPLCTVSSQPRTYIAQPTTPLTIEECGFRMLQPHEIHQAMAFPDDYVVLGNKRQQVKQYGNAVTPPTMKMLIKRCLETF